MEPPWYENGLKWQPWDSDMGLRLPRDCRREKAIPCTAASNPPCALCWEPSNHFVQTYFANDLKKNGRDNKSGRPTNPGNSFCCKPLSLALRPFTIVKPHFRGIHIVYFITDAD